jgi:hypothetical protein
MNSRNSRFLTLIFLLVLSCSEEDEIVLSSEKVISDFRFLKSVNTALDKDYIATISATSVSVDIPSAFDLSNLKATFSISPKALLKAGSVSQISGQTANNFASPLTYTVVAEDKSSVNYTVTVNKILSSQKFMTEFKFLKSTNPHLDKDYSGVISGNNITVDFPHGFSTNDLIATFSISNQATAKVGAVLQTSGQTKNNFDQTVTYTIAAEDNSISTYTISLNKIGQAPNLNINKTTSYHQYISNILYVNLATVMPQTPLYGAYSPDSYNSRAYADFDKDGDFDVMAVSFNFDSNTGVDVEYYKNTSGTFAKDQTVFGGNIPKYVHGRKAIIGDFDKNGWTDVVIAGHGYDKPPFPGEEAKMMLNSNGSFTTKILPLPAGFYHSVCSGDVDNDGDVDLFFTNNFSTGKFLVNDGAGNFSYAASLFPNLLGSYFTSELYDINNDGYLDLINTGHEMEGANSIVLWGNYSGKYSTDRMTVLPKVTGNQIAIAISFIDYNTDGKLDMLLVRTGDNTGSLAFYQGYYIQLLRNDGSSFTDVTSTNIINNSDPNAPKWINWLRVHDLDNDGDLDFSTDDKIYNLEWKNSNGVFSR